MVTYPRLHDSAMGARTNQWLLESSETSTAVTDCCPDPEPYFTSCEWSRNLKSVLISFSIVPHVTNSAFDPEEINFQCFIQNMHVLF